MTTSFNGAYFQNFDTLANTGTITWTDNSTLPGWYSTRSSYIAGSGNSSINALYSFGNGNLTDRALGSIAGNNTGNIYYGVRLVNNSGEEINILRVEYTGEQWRNGGNTSRQKLNFSYQIGTGLTNLTSGNWTSVTALDFTGPIASSTASQLLGTNSANQSFRSAAITLPKPLGVNEEIFLRWEDINDSGNNHGLGIDNIRVLIAEAPILTLSSNPLSYTENTGLKFVDDIATVFDWDSPNFNTGKLTLRFTNNANNDDILAIRNTPISSSVTGSIGLGQNSTVVYNFGSPRGIIPIGTVTGGTNGQPLEITFNQFATPQAVQALMRNILYGNTSDNPLPGNRTLSIQLSDDAGLVSNQVTKTINFSTVNDVPVIGTPGKTINLYNGTGTPDQQGFVYQPFPYLPNAVSGGNGELFTIGVNQEYAGYFAKPELIPSLDRNTGYSIKFKLQVFSEERSAGADKNGDGTDDRAGFNVILLGNDKKGIELGFWKDRIWAQNDGTAEPPNGTLFTQGEGVNFNTTVENTYELKVFGNTYSLFINNSQTASLTGKVRDYTSSIASPFLPTNVYQIPNFLFFGDNTPTASSYSKLGEISLTTGSTGNISVSEDTDSPIRGLTINDVDSGNSNVTVNLTVNSGQLRLDTAINGGVSSISGNGTQNLILTGTVNQINTTLANAGLTYRSNTNYYGSDTLTISASDGTVTLPNETVSITVNPTPEWQIAATEDFNGDNKQDILQRDLETGAVRLWRFNQNNISEIITLPTMDSNWQIAGVAKFSIDNIKDILWYNSTTGENRIWQMGANQPQVFNLLTVNPSNKIEFVGDFDNDGDADILWRNSTNGGMMLRRMNNTTLDLDISLPSVFDNNFKIEKVADFDGDNDLDILWYNRATGFVCTWEMNGANFARGVGLGSIDTNFQIAYVGNFDGDSDLDILWRNSQTGSTSIWEMNGVNLGRGVDLGRIDTNFKIAHVGNFDSDNDLEILWYNTQSGFTCIWDMNGVNFGQGRGIGTVGNTNTKIQKVADFDNDGDLDILWYNESIGFSSIWQMNGTSLGSGFALPTQEVGFRVNLVGDFDGNGKLDVLWYNSTNSNTKIWLTDGTNRFGDEIILPNP